MASSTICNYDGMEFSAIGTCHFFGDLDFFNIVNCLLWPPFWECIHQGPGVGHRPRPGDRLHRVESWRPRRPQRQLRLGKRPQDQYGHPRHLIPWAKLEISDGDCWDNPPIEKEKERWRPQGRQNWRLLQQRQRPPLMQNTTAFHHVRRNLGLHRRRRHHLSLLSRRRRDRDHFHYFHSRRQCRHLRYRWRCPLKMCWYAGCNCLHCTKFNRQLWKWNYSFWRSCSLLALIPLRRSNVSLRLKKLVQNVLSIVI